MEEPETKTKFLFRNLFQGILWFAVIITVFIFLEDYLSENFQDELKDFSDAPFFFYGIFLLSEVVFGIIPPEFFEMVWVVNKVSAQDYIAGLLLLTLISYLAGVFGYFLGRNFSRTRFYRRIKVSYLRRYELLLKRYGGYLVFVGAVTPIPFSATCMLAGSVEFNFREFLLICLARILRFGVYGYLVWSFPGMFS